MTVVMLPLGVFVISASARGGDLRDRTVTPDPCSPILDPPRTGGTPDPFVSAGLGHITISKDLVETFPRIAVICLAEATQASSHVEAVFVRVGDSSGNAAILTWLHPIEEHERPGWRQYVRQLQQHAPLTFVDHGSVAFMDGHPRAAEAREAYDMSSTLPLWDAVEGIVSSRSGSDGGTTDAGHHPTPAWPFLAPASLVLLALMLLSRPGRRRWATAGAALLSLSVIVPAVPALAGHGSWTDHDLFYKVLSQQTGAERSYADLSASATYDLGHILWEQYAGDRDDNNPLISKSAGCEGNEACGYMKTVTVDMGGDYYLAATMCAKDGTHVLPELGTPTTLIFSCSIPTLAQHTHRRDV